jgi:hypothetical protein
MNLMTGSFKRLLTSLMNTSNGIDSSYLLCISINDGGILYIYLEILLHKPFISSIPPLIDNYTYWQSFSL